MTQTDAFDGYKNLYGHSAHQAFLHDLSSMFFFVHQFNIIKGWWSDPATGQLIPRSVPEVLMLVVSECGEAMEGRRKSLADDKLPNQPMYRVEIMDAIIRLLDLGGADDTVYPNEAKMIHPGQAEDAMFAAQAFCEKFIYNHTRADHKLANRVLPGGKAY